MKNKLITDNVIRPPSSNLNTKVRIITAENKSAFTFTGTNTYIIGDKDLAIIDPGPNLQPHYKNILQTIDKATVSHIILTHSHQDHCANSIQLAVETGAKISLLAEQKSSNKELMDRIHDTDRLHYFNQQSCDKIEMQRLSDGMKLSNDEWCLEVIATPGHLFDHICLALAGSELIFTGDHVMGWSSTVIIPPSGNMTQFISSLQKLLIRTENFYLPGHGPVIGDAKKYVRQQLEHRELRKNQIINL